MMARRTVENRPHLARVFCTPTCGSEFSPSESASDGHHVRMTPALPPTHLLLHFCFFLWRIPHQLLNQRPDLISPLLRLR